MPSPTDPLASVHCRRRRRHHRSRAQLQYVCKYENQIVKIGLDHRWLFALVFFVQPFFYWHIPFRFLFLFIMLAFPLLSKCFMSELLQMVQVGICGGLSPNCTMQTKVNVMHVYRLGHGLCCCKTTTLFLTLFKLAQHSHDATKTKLNQKLK